MPTYAAVPAPANPVKGAEPAIVCEYGGEKVYGGSAGENGGEHRDGIVWWWLEERGWDGEGGKKERQAGQGRGKAEKEKKEMGNGGSCDVGRNGWLR